MRRIAVALTATVALGLVSPSPVQAHQGEELIQETNGSILLLTRFTDGEGGWPGLVRRVYNASAATNGLIGYVINVDPATRMGGSS